MPDFLLKVAEFAAKYFWAVAVVCAFVLFVPDDVATQLGTLKLRHDYRALLWVVLVFCSALWVAAMIRYVDERILGGWLETRRAAKKAQQDTLAAAQQEAREAEAFARRTALRLAALNVLERRWLQYCLFHNVQTLSTVRTNVTAQSLVHKDLLEEGPGHIMDLPFHIPDRVWQYLLDHRRDVIAEDEENSRVFLQQLIDFHQALHED